jgi:chemotaxis regulatin CheY-phosphate phosphatase CheZ
MRPPEELLYDSEASLRLVDHAIEELSSSGAEMDGETRGFLEHVMTQPGGFADLSRTLLRAYAETVGIVQRIRESCGMVDPEGLDRLQQMYGRLREVASATESATNDILSAVARANAVAERLNAATDAERPQMVASLKEELNAMANHLQFQDITSQQLGHVASLLADMRHRITQIVTLMSTPSVSFAKDEGAAFDPNASVSPSAAGDRQAVADEIFAVRATRKTA